MVQRDCNTLLICTNKMILRNYIVTLDLLVIIIST